MNRLFTIIFLFFIAQGLNAQIPAPLLYCIKGDTIRWDFPNVNCGAIQSYEIYYSATLYGPYSLLTSVTDITQNEYVWSANPGGNIFFYMTTTASCPGLMSLSSDTLDSTSPQPAIIESASVNGQDIHIQWLPSPSPETWAYIIYKGFPDGGVQTIDTVFNLSYLDVNKSVHDSTYTYYITAIDRCGGTSVFSPPHTTVVLTGSIDTCTGIIEVNFNPYVGLASPEYNLIITENGNTLTPEPLNGIYRYNFDQAIDQTEYCFTVDIGGTISSQNVTSNMWCVQTRQSVTLETLCLSGLVTDESGQIVNFNYETNNNARVEQLTFKQATSSSGIQTTTELFVIEEPDRSLPGSGQDEVFYNIQGEDICGNIASTGYFNTIQLSALLKPDQTVELNWNAPVWENFQATGCLIERTDPSGQQATVFQGDCALLASEDILQVGVDEANSYCYRLTANMVGQCEGQAYEILFNSNTACVEKAAGFYVPNAFIPNGVTPVFKPLIYFRESLATFKMTIFDRYGGKIFETTDPDLGWDGNSSKRKVNPGPYGYLIRITSTNGKSEEQRGSVTLLR